LTLIILGAGNAAGWVAKAEVATTRAARIENKRFINNSFL
jgi:hypothetical protein